MDEGNQNRISESNAIAPDIAVDDIEWIPSFIPAKEVFGADLGLGTADVDGVDVLVDTTMKRGAPLTTLINTTSDADAEGTGGTTQGTKPEASFKKPRTRPSRSSMTPAERERERAMGKDAQRRFRERTKSVIGDLEHKVAKMKLELENEKLDYEKTYMQNVAMNELIQRREGRFSSGKLPINSMPPVGVGLNDGEGICIVPEPLEFVEPVAKSVYDIEKLLRCKPAGYSAHLGPNGIAISAPPISAVLEHFRGTLTAMRQLLQECAYSIEQLPLDSNANDHAAVSNSIAQMVASAASALPPGAPMPALFSPTSGALEQITTLTYNNVAYKLTKPLLEKLIDVGIKHGLVTWQQVVCFPMNTLKIACYNIETGEPAAVSEIEDVDRCQHILRAIHLRREQQEAIVKLHREYLATIRPALRERAAVIQHLRDCNVDVFASSSQAYAQRALQLGENLETLEGAARVEYIAFIKLNVEFSNCLDFPIQRSLLQVLSYPYYYQVPLLCACIAMELGINVFDESYCMPPMTNE